MSTTKPTRVLIVDPSSSRTGCVVATGPMEIERMELCRPASPDASALERARSMADDVAAIIRELHIGHVVIETPALHAYKYTGYSGHGLALYGLAVGIIIVRASEVIGWNNMTPVPADQWVPKRTTKKMRQLSIAAQFPAYREMMNAGKDPGADIADAIGLYLWWKAQERRL